MKRYIKPSTDITSVELQQMIAASPDLTGNEATQGAEHEYDDAKGFDFFAAPEVEEETPNKNKLNQEEEWDEFEEEE